MRILYLTTGLSLGGAERQLALMSGIMAGRGHEVRVVSMLPAPREGGVALDQRIGASDLGMRKGRPGIEAIFRLAGAIGEFRPDVVHSHMIHANMLACATRSVCRMKRLVCTAHSDSETSSRLMLWAYKRLSRRCDIFTHVSRAAAERYAGLGIRGPDGIVPVHNGIEWERFASPGSVDRKAVRKEFGIPDDAYVFAFVGRLEPIKGPDIAIEAFRSLTGARPGVHLLMVGDGSLGASLRGGVSDPRVLWAGSTDRPERYLRAADCLVMPSRHEGFGLSIVEAMAVGLSIVATDCAGPREILMDGRYGRIVPREAPAALARAMAECVKEGRLSPEPGREYSRGRFDADRIADEWLKIYGNQREGS